LSLRPVPMLSLIQSQPHTNFTEFSGLILSFGVPSAPASFQGSKVPQPPDNKEECLARRSLIFDTRFAFS